MVARKNKTGLQEALPWWRWVLIALNMLALVLSTILSWHYLKGGSMIGCSSGGPCEQVLNSHWSMIAGLIPVSGLAVGTYLAILVASFFTGPKTETSIRRLAWNAMLVLVGTIAGSAVWFTILQKWVIGDFCFYCMTTHITGLLLATLVIWRAIIEFNNNSKNILMKNIGNDLNISQTSIKRNKGILYTIGMFSVGLVLVGLMVAFQVNVSPSTIYSDGESQVNLSKTDYHNMPIVGSPDAQYIVTLLFDYQCPHCQKLHFMLNDAIHRYNGKLAFVLYPTPLNTKCNPYIPRDVTKFKHSCELAEIGLTIWKADHKAFAAFENWMYSFESGDIWHPRSLDAAKTKAVELIGKTKFDNASINPWIGEYMKSCVELFGQTMQNGNGGIPKLIYNSHWVIPEPTSVDDLVMILQKSLTLPRP